MAKSSKPPRWKTSESKIVVQVQALVKQRATLLFNADRVHDLDAKRQMWQAAQRLEDRIEVLKGRIHRILAKKYEETQPSLFDS